MRAALPVLVGLAFVACVATPEDPVPGPTVEIQDPDDGKPDDPAAHGDDCLDGWCEDPGEDPDQPVCEPRGCDGECGVIDDDCGGTIQCGPCACEPTTCDEAGATCGSVDDGCGGTLNCDAADAACSGSCVDNQCVCDGDDAEPNDTSGDAVNLGAVVQGDGLELQQAEVTLDELDDIDWYVASVADDWSWGNPHVHATVQGAEGYIVTVYYFCDYGPDTWHECESGVPWQDGFGIGCQGAGRVTLVTECEGGEEAGTAYVAVEVGEAAVVCEPYTIGVEAS
jgi:hypothetical protein